MAHSSRLTSSVYRHSLLGIAALHICIYGVVVLARIRHPFELEWMEGGALDQVRRILSGQTRHVSPSMEEELLGAFGGNETSAGATLVEELTQEISERRFGAIILDSYPMPANIVQCVEEHYVSQGPVFDSRSLFWPMTGKLTRPELLYVPEGDDGDSARGPETPCR